MSRCLITGCAVVDQICPRWRWGDLYQEGSAFIHYSEQDWTWGKMADTHKALLVHDFAMPFEKNGVFVVRALDASLNTPALDYLKYGEKK